MSSVKNSKNKKLDRIDGPAVIRPDGTKEFWLNGYLFKVTPNPIPNIYKKKVSSSVLCRELFYIKNN
jgi:hypothetical protein